MDKIDNLTKENVWFRNNVFFIFAKGCIFSSSDDKKLAEVLEYFRSTSPVYLNNKYILMDYTQEGMEAIEKKLLIGHGNYHICFIIGVYNSADISKAPEREYAKHGLVSYYTSWKDVTDIFVEIVGKYGYKNKKQLPQIMDTIRPPQLPEYLDPNAAVSLAYDLDLKNDLEKLNQPREKIKTVKEGLYERIRNLKTEYPAQDFINNLIPRSTNNTKEIPNKIEYYDDEYYDDKYDADRHNAPLPKFNLHNSIDM